MTGRWKDGAPRANGLVIGFFGTLARASARAIECAASIEAGVDDPNIDCAKYEARKTEAWQGWANNAVI